MTMTLSSVGTNLSQYTKTYSSSDRQIRLYNAKNIIVSNNNSTVQNKLKNLKSVRIGNTISSLPNYSFYNCTNLNDVRLASSVISVGQYSFNNCTNLKEVDFRGGISSVNAYMFNNCNSLTSVAGLDNVTMLCSTAFQNCQNLKSIGLKNLRFKNERTDGMNGFSNCPKLISVYVDNEEYHSIDNGYGMKDSLVCSKDNKNLAFAANGLKELSSDEINYVMYDGCKNSQIQDVKLSNCLGINGYAFYNCQNLSSVNFPKLTAYSVSYAFYNCNNLLSVEMPRHQNYWGWNMNYLFSCQKLRHVVMNSTVQLGQDSFSYCPALSVLNLPGTQRLSWRSFYNCQALTDLSIKNLTTCSDGNFSLMTKLSNFYVDNSTYKTIDNGYGDGRLVLVTTNEQSLVATPCTVKRLSNDNITTILSWSLDDASNISSINLSSITTINSNGIQSGHISSLYFPQLTSIANNGIKSMSYLTDFIIGNDTQTQIVTLGSGNLTSIQSDLKIFVPDSLYENYLTATNWCALSSHLFRNVTNINDITKMDIQLDQAYPYNEGNPVEPVPNVIKMRQNLTLGTDFTCQYQNNREIGTATITITGIGNYTGTCTRNFQIILLSETIVNIDPSLTTDNQYIIYSGTKKSDSPQINISWGDGQKTTITSNISNTSHTYSDSAKRKVKISDNITSLKLGYSSGFTTSTKKITSIEKFGESLTSIDQYGFAYLENLRAIDLSNTNISQFGNYTFYSSTNLNTIILGNKLTTIPTYCFQETNLSSLTIPSALTSIGNYAFRYCPIQYLSVDANNPMFDSRDNCNAIITTSNNTLKQASMNTIIPSTVSALGVRSYAHLPITSITIPSHVTALGGTTLINGYAFQYCEDLLSVQLHDGITEMGYGTFNNCFSLQYIQIPSSVSTIRGVLFSGCTNLKVISFDRHTSVPTLAATTAFNSMPSDYKIIVPSSLYSTWIAATNWNTATISSHIVAKSNDISDAAIICDGIMHMNSSGVAQMKPNVYVGSDNLIENTDYTLSYSGDNVEGIASCMINAIGNYTGTKTFTYEVRAYAESWFEMHCDDYEGSFWDMHILKVNSDLYEIYLNWNDYTQKTELLENDSASHIKIQKTDGQWRVIDDYIETDSQKQITTQDNYMDFVIDEQTLFSGNKFKIGASELIYYFTYKHI